MLVRLAILLTLLSQMFLCSLLSLLCLSCSYVHCTELGICIPIDEQGSLNISKGEATANWNLRQAIATELQIIGDVRRVPKKQW